MGRQRVQGLRPQRSRRARVLPACGLLVLGPVLFALLRNDFVGLAWSLGIALVVTGLLALFAPKSWRTSGDPAREQYQRVRRVPVIGQFLRVGEYLNHRTGFDPESVLGWSKDPEESEKNQP